MGLYEFIDYFHKTEAEKQARKYKKLVEYLDRKIAEAKRVSDDNNDQVAVKHEKYCDYPDSSAGRLKTTYDLQEAEMKLFADVIKNKSTSNLADLGERRSAAVNQMNYWNEQVRIEDERIKQQIAAFLGGE